MKKIFAFTVAVFLSAGVFSLYSEDYSKNFEAEDEFSNEFWITNRNIGIGVPIMMPNFNAVAGGMKDVGVSWLYKEQHIFWPNGFVFQFEAAQGVLMNQGLCYEDNFQIGFGYAFVSDCTVDRAFRIFCLRSYGNSFDWSKFWRLSVKYKWEFVCRCKFKNSYAW